MLETREDLFGKDYLLWAGNVLSNMDDDFSNWSSKLARELVDTYVGMKINGMKYILVYVSNTIRI